MRITPEKIIRNALSTKGGLIHGIALSAIEEMRREDPSFSIALPESWKVARRVADEVVRGYFVGLSDTGARAVEQMQLMKIGTDAQKVAAKEYIGEKNRKYSGLVFQYAKLTRDA